MSLAIREMQMSCGESLCHPSQNAHDQDNKWHHVRQDSVGKGSPSHCSWASELVWQASVEVCMLALEEADTGSTM